MDIVDGQEMLWYSKTPIYDGACNYAVWLMSRDWRWTLKQWEVMKQDYTRRVVHLPKSVNIPDSSKVVLDNWKSYLVVDSDSVVFWPIDRTFLLVEHTETNG